MTTPEQQLSEFRAQIDALDDTITRALLDRCGIVRQVAALKAAHWPADCHIRSGREGQMHRAIVERFSGTDIPPIVALAIWRQLIGASTHLESPLSISFCVDFAEHFWLAREYFGPQIDLHPAESFKAALADMQAHKSTILLLTAALDAPCWTLAEAIQAAGLRIFAALPVVADALPAHMKAVALARITPEPSGDDISYFLWDGKLITVDGFHETHENALYLGAHPRLILLNHSSK